ncbi:adhesin [Spirosoma jeollabukense]
MIYQPTFDQDEDVLMLNPDPETFDDEDDDFDGGADFDELGSGAASGYGADDLDDIEDEFSEDDLEELDDDSIDDDLDDDSME